MSRTHSFTLLLLTLAYSPTLLVAATEPTQVAPHPAPQASDDVGSLEGKPKTELKIAPQETVIYVGDLHCKHCAKKIASKLYAVKGVTKVRTDIKADVAIVTPQQKKQLDPLALWSATQKSGFPALKLVGPTGTYVWNAKTKTAERLAEAPSSPQG